MTARGDGLATARSFLFVPGDRADRIPKAVRSTADLAIIDLEDAVAPHDKDAARAITEEWLDNPGVAVRINAPGTPWFEDDVAMVSGRRCVVMLPKSDSVETVETVATTASVCGGLVALVETAAGVLAAPGLAATPAVERLAFGNVDLGAELGVDPDDRATLAHARSALVLASAAAGKPGPIDGVTTALNDPNRLRDDLEDARRAGFTGKLCIHPSQVGPTNEAFNPSGDEVAWATSVLAASSDDGVTVVEGHMIDKPVIDRARHMLSLHARRREAAG